MSQKTDQQIRRSPEHIAWSNAVRTRDNWTCQKCGHRPKSVSGRAKKRMHAHHIIPFAECSEKRFDVQNGITLCKPCHRQLHADLRRKKKQTKKEL